jgi:N-methylhydantoinase A
MRGEAETWANAQGDELADAVVWVAADMRYVGQAYELEIELSQLGSERKAENLSALFHAAHTHAYGFPDDESSVEVMNIRLSVVRQLPTLPAYAVETAADKLHPVGKRPVFWNDETIEAAVFSRADMKAGHVIMGPAIVEQQDTTTWLSPHWNGQVLRSGSLRLQPAPQDKDG